MTDQPSSEPTGQAIMRDLYTSQLAGRVSGIAGKLRALADDIDRKADLVRDIPTTGAKSGAEVATNVVHTVTRAFANLNLSDVVEAAAIVEREVLGGAR